MDVAREDVIDRARGALVGLAVGDALGTTVEFQAPGTFEPVNDIVGGGPFRLRPGEFTDDTSMALCLASSLVELGRFDAIDQLERYVRWWRRGELSSTGRCFDIGNATRHALGRFERLGVPDAGSSAEHRAGNGSLMRLAPVAMFATSAEEAIELSARSSRTTHAAPQAVDACRYFGALLYAAIHGASREELLAPGFWSFGELHPEVAEVAGGSFRHREPPRIAGSGYVVRTLEAALWAVDRGAGFEDRVLRAVNLGDDADTTGAVCGQLAGALEGELGIPSRWRGRLALHAEIDRLARLLAARAADGEAALPPVPWPDTFWVEPGRLLAGEYPGSTDRGTAERKLRALLDAGIRRVVDLTEAEEGLRAYERMLAAVAAEAGLEIDYRRMPIADVGTPRSAEQARSILDALGGEVPTYVHCWGGVGRTGTVVGCHLVERGLEGDAALQRLAELRDRTPKRHRTAPETDEQRAYVRAWSAR